METSKSSETLTEGWVKFTRRYFSEGYIDRWVGDSINNPNNSKQHQMQLNSFASYYRIEGGQWVNNHELFKMNQHWQMTHLTAQMIWDNCYHDYQAILNKQ